MQVAALFTQDAAGRLLRVNEPDGGVAPRLFLGETEHGAQRWYRADVSPTMIAALERVPPDAIGTFVEMLSREAPVERISSGPAFRFPDTLAPSRAIAVTAANSAVLQRHLGDWLDAVESMAPLSVMLVDGHAVSVCASARRSDGAYEAGVETARGFRARGFGAQAVLGWAAQVRALGRIPIYSCAWANEASRALARSLGLTQFATNLHLT